VSDSPVQHDRVVSACIEAPTYGTRVRKAGSRPQVTPGNGAKRSRRAYVAAWEGVHGPVPDGMVIHHLCGNAYCVNVEHLHAMTRSDHIREHGLPGDNHQAKKTQCRNGHEFTHENTYVDPEGHRTCRICHRSAVNRHAAKKRREP
jgi:hypothetical protein